MRADLTLVRYPNGGAVFSTGSIGWAGALAHDGYDNDVALITDNVLRAFASDRALEWPRRPDGTNVEAAYRDQAR